MKRPKAKPLTEQIRAALKSSPLTAYRLAKMTGIPRSTLSRFLGGSAGMTLKNLDKLAAALDLRLAEPTKQEQPTHGDRVPKATR
jgi:transcriptional regulator with XRE-family HTH domain